MDKFEGFIANIFISAILKGELLGVIDGYYCGSIPVLSAVDSLE